MNDQPANLRVKLLKPDFGADGLKMPGDIIILGATLAKNLAREGFWEVIGPATPSKDENQPDSKTGE